MMYKWGFFPLWLPLLWLAFGCAPVRSTRFVLPEAPEASGRKGAFPAGYTGQLTWQNHLPDPAHPEYMPIRYVRVNFHVMNSRDSSRNFKPAAARAYLKDLLARANVELDTNWVNWRSPEGTKILPKRYRYVLSPQPVPGDDGFYFHYDDAHYTLVYIGEHQNNYDREVIDKYGIGTDSIINVFVQVHPDDSLRSRTYRSTDQGIALGTALKMANLYESKGEPQRFVGLFNHEIGHILGLSHAWAEDGCPDTDNHPNRCWTWTETGPCRDQASDNMMDYNTYKVALTPCQIGRVHAAFSSEQHPVRRCLQRTWCVRNPDMDVVVRDSVHWAGARDLEGNLTITKDGALRLSGRLSLPADAQITVEPGGRLWLDGSRVHNACKEEWKGIFVQENRKLKQKGLVKILRTPVLENTKLGRGIQKTGQRTKTHNPATL